MSKKIEPTDAMVDEAADAVCLAATDTSLSLYSGPVKRAYRTRASAALRVGLNHPDARGLFTTEDDRPWEPLAEGAPLNVGDEVRRDHHGITTIGVVAYVDKNGDPFAAGGYLIAIRRNGTWHVRRPAQDLPTEDGAQIIPAHEAIEAVRNGVTYRAARATYDAVERIWVGIWRGEGGRSTYEMPASLITLRTAQGVE